MTTYRTPKDVLVAMESDKESFSDGTRLLQLFSPAALQACLRSNDLTKTQRAYAQWAADTQDPSVQPSANATAERNRYMNNIAHKTPKTRAELKSMLDRGEITQTQYSALDELFAMREQAGGQTRAPAASSAPADMGDAVLDVLSPGWRTRPMSTEQTKVADVREQIRELEKGDKGDRVVAQMLREEHGVREVRP